MDKRITILVIITLVLLAIVGILYFRGSQEDSELAITQEDQLSQTPEDTFVQQTALIEKAVETDTLTLNNCKTDPEVLRTAKGSTINVVNKGKSETSITIDQRTHTIPASESIEIVADSPQGPGIYPYLCGDSEEFAGYILVEQK